MSEVKTQAKGSPEFSLHLTVIAVEVLLRRGVSKSNAIAVGQEIAERCCKNLGGRAVYIPKNMAAQTALKAIAIYEEFDGSNYVELAQKYDLTETWVRQLVKRKHQEQRRAV